MALSDIDRRHIFNFNYIHTLPFFAKSSSVRALNVPGGWEGSWRHQFQSGAPNTVNAPVDIARIGCQLGAGHRDR